MDGNTILIVDDEAPIRDMIRMGLEMAGYDCIEAADSQQAHALIIDSRPDLVLLDWMMPGIEGIEICRRIRENSKKEDQYTYITLLTAKESKENIVSGMDAGADDYITKPFDMHELRVRVRAGQRIVQLQSELLEAKNNLEIQSRTDPLTGVLNRRAILSQIGREISRAKRDNTHISISMLDFDHFKKINDTFGHLAGDAVLREGVNRVEETIRTYDAVGRFGGEEFIVVLPGANQTDAFVIAERIRLKINDKNANADGVSIPFAISQGLATSNGESTVDELIAKADEALYRAKENGRNRVEQASLQEE